MRPHTYLGYALRLQGMVGDEESAFLIGIGKVTQAKHAFRVGDVVSGKSRSVADDRLEPVAYYKTSALKLVERGPDKLSESPPWMGVPPDLAVFRSRGHRRLSARTYERKCLACMWGCRMPVEIVVDHWKPDVVRYRFETFCYGPKSCKLHRPGPMRRVPGRRGMVWVEEDWVEEQALEHRGPDE